QALTVALILVAIVTSGVVLLNWAGHRHIPGLAQIAIGFCLIAAGGVGFSMLSQSEVALSIFLVNACILGGRTIAVSGFANFWNQERSRLPVFATFLFLVGLLLIGYFTLLTDSPTWRIRTYTATSVILSCCTIYVIATGLRIEKSLRPAMTVTTSYGALLAILLFCFNAATDSILLFIRTDIPLADSEGATAMLFLRAIFTLVVFAFAFLLMTMEELTVEHKENAIYDPITTILNQRTFLEVGQRVCGVALRYEKPVSMLTLEVENMDQVVKEYGYKVANELLRHFSLMATDRRRNEDVLGRFSFNEFRMLLPGVDEEGAKVVMTKIHESVKGEDYIYRGKKVTPRLTIGSITRREEDLSLSQMLQDGEIALFRIKQAAS
ncbi:MAG: diguanylate cyclase, partial [Gammaproteobacteria bacterium]